MPQGKVKKLITNRGYGFLETEEGDLFFHSSAVQETVFEQLYEGLTVEYEKGTGPQGKPVATSVKPN